MMMTPVAVPKRVRANDKGKQNHHVFEQDIVNNVNTKNGQTRENEG